MCEREKINREKDHFHHTYLSHNQFFSTNRSYTVLLYFFNLSIQYNVQGVIMNMLVVHREINFAPLVAQFTGSAQGFDHALMLGLKILEESLFAQGP